MTVIKNIILYIQNNEICYLIILQIPYNLSLIQSDLNIEPNLYIL